MKLAYCDYIADRIRKLLAREVGDNDTLISTVGKVEMDLHPTEGYFQSTKKTMIVRDVNGKAYSITIEEQPVLDIWYEDVDQETLDNEFK
jgi:predicted DsbA family dithiol-disulfide isomerase